MNSDLVQKDPELKKTLTEIRSTVEEKEWEAKRADSWKDITAEVRITTFIQIYCQLN